MSLPIRRAIAVALCAAAVWTLSAVVFPALSAEKKVAVALSPPAVVAVSPPEYAKDPAGRWWGFFQFPDMWRGNDGVLYLAVNVGADSAAGRHEPTQFYASGDGGTSWRQVTLGETDRTREVIELPGGKQVAFGQDRHLYHYAALSPDAALSTLDVTSLGLQPVAGPLRDGYKVNEYMAYEYGDIPPLSRNFPMAVRESAAGAWQETTGVLDFPSLRLSALTRAMWWDDKGKEVWRELPPRLTVPMPQAVTVLPDGVLLWALASLHPDANRKYHRVTCVESRDGGVTWRVRGTIADALDTSWGYGFGEQSLTRMPNGDLLCAMRTKASNESKDTHHLATARSTDDGVTWTPIAPLSQFSVTPHLLTLGNGAVAAVYGRPGVHVKATIDSGVSWTESQPLVGPTESEVMAKKLSTWWASRHNYSCANTTVVVTGPDRFLVAYSDFKYKNSDGKLCKAICVREVRVTTE